MGDVLSSEGRIAGIALLLSVASIMTGFLIVVAQGKVRGLSAGFRGVEGVGEAASALSTMSRAGFVYTLLQLVGFGILAVMLRDRGEGWLATVSFAVLIFASAATVARPSFEGIVTVWASDQWAATGSVPELYDQLHAWVSHVFEFAYVAVLVAMVGFGWGILSAQLLAPWVGWVSIGWSALWVVAYLFGMGLPAILILYPLVYGIGLLL